MYTCQYVGVLKCDNTKTHHFCANTNTIFLTRPNPTHGATRDGKVAKLLKLFLSLKNKQPMTFYSEIMALIIIIVITFLNFHCNYHLYCRHRHLLFTYHYGIINAPHSCPVFLTAYQSYALRPSRSSIALTISLFWATSHDSDSTSDHKVLYNSYHIGLHGPTDEKSLSNCAELALMHSTLQSVAVFADMRE